MITSFIIRYPAALKKGNSDLDCEGVLVSILISVKFQLMQPESWSFSRHCGQHSTGLLLPDDKLEGRLATS